MSDHSPTPWTISEDGRFIIAADGKIIADIHGLNTTREEDRANIHRIMASVNACARLTDEELALEIRNIATEKDTDE